MPWERIKRLKTLHRVRLILCVGGWERSNGFSKVAADKTLLGNFVRSAVAICAEHRLDGIDLDWEHPKDEKEQQGYAKILQELRTAFQPQGLSLSISMAAWQSEGVLRALVVRLRLTVKRNAFGMVLHKSWR